MAKQTLYVVDPREKRLHPLRTRKDELLAKQSQLAEAGQHLADEEQWELREVIDEIAGVHAVGTSKARPGAVEGDLTVQCFGLGAACEARIDVANHHNVLADIHSVVVKDPSLELNDRVRCIFPPNLGTMILCFNCWGRLAARFQEQAFEVET